jgi:hypothetical protein
MMRMKEGEYGWSPFYIYMNMEHLNLSKSFSEGALGKRENNWEAEPNQRAMYVYMELSQRNPLY